MISISILYSMSGAAYSSKFDYDPIARSISGPRIWWCVVPRLCVAHLVIGGPMGGGQVGHCRLGRGVVIFFLHGSHRSRGVVAWSDL